MKSTDNSVALKFFFNSKDTVTHPIAWISSGDKFRDTQCIRAYIGAQLLARKKSREAAFR